MKALLPQKRRQQRARRLVIITLSWLLASVAVWWALLTADANAGASTDRYVERFELSLLEIALYGLLLLPVLYVSAILHEAGHAMLAYLAGLRLTAFGMGLGKPFLFVRLGKVRAYLASQAPFQGITLIFQPRLVSTPAQVLMFGLGGVLANLLLVPAALLVWAFWPFDYGETFWLLVAGSNGCFAIVNLVPIRVRIGHGVFLSDGAVVRYALRAGQFPSAPVNTIALVHTLRPLLRDIDNRLQHTVYLLAAAGAWRTLGCVARAEALCAEAAVDADITPEVAALFALIRAGVAMSAHQSAEANEYFDRAEAMFKSQQIDAGRFYTAFYRAQNLWHLGDVPASLALLQSLGENVLVRDRPAIRAEWLTACVEAHAVAGDDAALARLRADYETLRRAFPSVERDLVVYRALAVRADATGADTRAQTDFHAALAAAKQVYDGLPTDADRSDFLAGQQAPLFEPARACLLRLGKSEEAVRIDMPFRAPATAPALTEAQKAEQLHLSRRKTRRFLTLGLLVGMLDLVVASSLVALAVATRLPEDPGTPLDPVRETQAVFGILLFMGAIVALPLGGVWYIAGLFLPALHNRGGWIVLVAALLPWVLATLLAAALRVAG